MNRPTTQGEGRMNRRELVAAHLLMGGIVAAVLYALCALTWVIA